MAALSLTNGRDFIRSLLGGERGFEQQQDLLRLQAKLARQAQPGVGAQLGSLAGMGAGAFLGGPGGAVLGQRLFGRRRGAVP